MRYAIKVYYSGENFHGSQIQPDVRTVEGEILKALEDMEVEVRNFQRAARTDRYVSALGNVFAFSCDECKIEPRILNYYLPEDIRVLACKTVHEKFNPRYEAKERIYKYFLLDEGYDIEKLKQACKVLEGKHSFHNFSRLEGRNPVREIKSIDVEVEEDFIILTFRARSFLRQMVRCLVTGIKLVASNEITIEELKKLLDPEYTNKIWASDPRPLILWDIVYDFEFEYENFSVEKFKEEIINKLKEVKTKRIMLEKIKNHLIGKS